MSISHLMFLRWKRYSSREDTMRIADDLLYAWMSSGKDGGGEWKGGVLNSISYIS
jgi:hypothetical protein